MEAVGLGRFLHKHLDAALGGGSRVGLKLFDRGGKDRYLSNLGADVARHLRQARVVAVFGLLDLYNLSTSGINMRGCTTSEDRVKAARKHIEGLMPADGRDKFHQHFAVHETEAWLLGCQEVFPTQVRPKLPKGSPEAVDLDNPPSKRIAEAYRRGFGNREYHKKKDGRALFDRLDPHQAAEACPHLKALLDDLLNVARNA